MRALPMKVIEVPPETATWLVILKAKIVPADTLDAAPITVNPYCRPDIPFAYELASEAIAN